MSRGNVTNARMAHNWTVTVATRVGSIDISAYNPGQSVSRTIELHGAVVGGPKDEA